MWSMNCIYQLRVLKIIISSLNEMVLLVFLLPNVLNYKCNRFNPNKKNRNANSISMKIKNIFSNYRHITLIDFLLLLKIMEMARGMVIIIGNS